MRKVRILDTTLRDGEQTPGVKFSVNEKLEIARKLSELNVDVIEAGFPVSCKSEFLAVKKVAENINKTCVAAFARAVNSDIDVAWDAIKDAENPLLHISIPTSKIHLMYKINKTEDEILSEIRNSLEYSRKLCPNIEIGFEDASRTGVNFLLECARTSIKHGAKIINIADTTGFSQANEFGNLIGTINRKLGKEIQKSKAIISVHCHNDLGNAVACSLEAIRNGAGQVECTINGIGERAGNCSLEELVMNLEVRKEYYNRKTGINKKLLFETSSLISKLSGQTLPNNKPIVGRNAFSHESGMHQNGVIKNRETYEIMDFNEVGWKGERFVIGKNSGKSGLKNKLKELNIKATDDEIREILVRIKNSRRKKTDCRAFKKIIADIRN
jgi:2-isopropylmalate synthase